jgi:hypothetical protein
VKSVEGFAAIARICDMKFGDTDMSHIDDMLDGLRAAPLPKRLMTIDEAVLSQLSARRANSDPLSGGMIGFAIIAAAGMGLVSTVVPSTSARAASSLSPFGAPAALAPSTLLDSGE